MQLLPELQPRVIARTAEWLVVDKPAHWLTVAGRDPACQAPVLQHWAEKELQKKDLHARIWVVHRLDLETSGVILFACSAEAHRKANEWFSRHQVKKEYQLLAQGRPRTPVLLLKSTVNGQSAQTRVEVRAQGAAAFWAQAYPKTGRRHQIRIHLAEAGFPLWGDTSYKGASRSDAGTEIKRVMLHAARLELPSGEVFESPLPEDFGALLEEIKK